MKNIILLFCLFSALNISATPAPDFTVTSSDNQVLKLYQNYINQGKLVVIEAFFTTCPPCNAHAPLLQNLYTQMLAAHPGKVEFILLSTLSTDTNVKVAQYKTSKGLTMPAAGANGNSQTALQPYTSGQFGPFQGTPTFIVVAPTSGTAYYDIRGNSASETMTLLQQKIAELLPAPPPPPVYCPLKDFFGNGLQEVQMDVTAQSFDTSFVVDGSYSLSNVAALKNKSYSITPQINDNPLNGITTYDLVLISKHILGIQALTCDWQLLAADVNCSGSITTLDIVTARKLILGITQALPCHSWRFLPESATDFNGDCTEFLGVKLGDVNAGPCAQFEPPPGDRSPLELALKDRLLRAGETVSVEVLAGETFNVQGLQATMTFDADQVAFRKISSTTLTEFDEDAYTLDSKEAGIVPIVWINPVGQTVYAGEPVLTLEITALKSGNLSDMLGLSAVNHLVALCYDEAGNSHPLDLDWQKEGAVASAAQVNPNPAKGAFSLSIPLPSEQNCLIQMFDLQGNIVLKKSCVGVRGMNHVAIAAEQVPPGLYCLTVNGKSVGKVVMQ